MRLHGYWRSSSSWRVRIALAWKGLEYEYVPVNLLKGEQHLEAYRALNPMRSVPMLELEEGGRTVRLAQSLAIIEFLEERYPSPALLPPEPLLRARARQLAEMVNSGIQPLQNLSVMQRIRADFGGDDKAWSRYWNERGLVALEQAVQPTAGRFSVGDEVSVADLCLVPQLYAARRFEVDLSAFPTLTRIESACAELPAFRSAHPSAQPDAVAPAAGV